MKKLVVTICFSFLLFSCSDIEFETDIINEDSLDISSINTKLCMINFRVDLDLFNSFYDKGRSGESLSIEMDVYDSAKNQVLTNLQAEIRVRGEASATYDLKSLEVILKNDFIQNDFQFVTDVPTISSNSLDTLSNFRLRNSGQDFFNSYVKDMAYNKLAVELGLDFESMYGTKPFQVFINGVYHGLLNARSESNIQGVSKLLGVVEDKMVMYKVSRIDQNIEYHEGNFELTTDLEAAIDDFSATDLYELIDIPSFIDYVIYEDYIGNFDWPNNNIRMYSLNGNPFRCVLYDLDLAAFQTKEVYLPRMEYQNYDLAKIYQKLRLVEGFDEQLKERQKDVYRKVSPSMFNAIVDELVAQIDDDIKYQINKYQAPENYLHWLQEIEKLKINFKSRDGYMRDYYKI